MLLKSVDHVFWLGRYLERLDDTARLINATSHVLIDSHQDTQFGWPILLDVCWGRTAQCCCKSFSKATRRSRWRRPSGR